ncbi:unnamed protein product [Strongylus vulgaris]|uniref:Uncharacterized protein n=1 Tax=Strongylus vulgaris TaxID=40348 RepID=A0A3P7JF37_STRVU|nr:unnamed protein product [Strongylus vulgaris]
MTLKADSFHRKIYRDDLKKQLLYWKISPGRFQHCHYSQPTNSLKIYLHLLFRISLFHVILALPNITNPQLILSNGVTN